MERALTAQERAQLFSAGTRQNLQMLPTMTQTSVPNTIQFNLPKARLLSKIYLNVAVKYTLTGTGAITAPANKLLPYKVIRRASVDMNNGFSPFVVSGDELAKYNMVRLNPSVIIPSTSTGSMCYFPTPAQDADGNQNTYNFTVELPITLNQRDPVGLVLLQSESTLITCTIDLQNVAEIIKTECASGSTAFVTDEVKITPMVETFTIPANPNAFPDLSVLKLVTSRTETFAGSGQNIVKLDVGTIYRKIIISVKNGAGANPDGFINGNIELVFNQADIPYSISPVALRHKNHSDLGYLLPDDMYVLDFTNQGISGLGGSRDYVDSERLSELWLRFPTTATGTVTVIAEKLSRLK